jgi:outer membrane protein assembly factor BamB
MTISPIIVHGEDGKKNVIVSYSSGHMMSIDLSSGDALWMYDLLKDAKYSIDSAPANVSCQPLYHNGYIYVASNNGMLIKVHAYTGEVVWKHKIEDVQSMSIIGNVIYLTTNALQVAALDYDTGNVIWATGLHTEKQKAVSMYLFAPFANTEYLFVISDNGYVHTFNPYDGHLVGKSEIGEHISSFAIHDGKLVIFSKKKMFVE